LYSSCKLLGSFSFQVAYQTERRKEKNSFLWQTKSEEEEDKTRFPRLAYLCIIVVKRGARLDFTSS